MKESKKDLYDEIKERILLFDGAMGTMLQAKGYDGTPDLANLDKKLRDIVAEIHLEYLIAGADIILANTFGASYLKLKTSGNEDDIESINKNAVESARNAVETYRQESGSSRPIFIAGDLGPSGKLLKPSGDIEPAQLMDSYRRQAEILIRSDVDLILIETMIDLNEALAAIDAVRDIEPDITIASTLTFNKSGTTMMGDKAELVGKELLSEGADIIGANCSIGSSYMLPIVEKFRRSNPGAKLIFQPNAGMPKVIDGKTVFDEGPDEMAKNIKEYLRYEPSILGTCCGSTPDHTKKVHEIIRDA